MSFKSRKKRLASCGRRFVVKSAIFEIQKNCSNYQVRCALSNGCQCSARRLYFQNEGSEHDPPLKTSAEHDLQRQQNNLMYNLDFDQNFVQVWNSSSDFLKRMTTPNQYRGIWIMTIVWRWFEIKKFSSSKVSKWISIHFGHILGDVRSKSIC